MENYFEQFNISRKRKNMSENEILDLLGINVPEKRRKEGINQINNLNEGPTNEEIEYLFDFDQIFKEGENEFVINSEDYFSSSSDNIGEEHFSSSSPNSNSEDYFSSPKDDGEGFNCTNLNIEEFFSFQNLEIESNLHIDENQLELPAPLPQITAPKTSIDAQMEDCKHQIYKDGKPLCFYCGWQFKLKDKQKEIISHLEECCKKSKMLIPIFQYKTEQGEIKNAFIKDCFRIGAPALYDKTRNRFKTLLKDSHLDLIHSKHPYYNKIPKTFKNPNNNRICIYEFERTSVNVAQEIFFGYQFSFVNTHLLID